MLEPLIRTNTFDSEIFRITKPGGQVFIFVPNDWLEPIDEPEHVIKYNRTTFETLLKRHFDDDSVEVVKGVNFAMTVLLGRARKATPQGCKR